MDREELYLNIINNLCDGVYFVDVDRKIQFWNSAAERITGYKAEEIVGKACHETHLNHIDEDGRPLCTIGCPLFATIIDSKQRQARVFVRHKDGHRIPILVNVLPMLGDGQVLGAIEIFTQDSPTVYEDRLVEQLSGMAMHDPLTDLPNRRYIESFLSYKLDSFNRFGKSFALMFADIDDFRGFNNRYGHDVGDAVLKNIATSVKRTTRQGDLIGRWGGEELVGVFSIDKAYDAPIIAEKFRVLVEGTDVQHGDELLRVTLSIGITVVRPSDTIESIIDRADQLMYKSKQAGKNKISAD